MVSRLVLYGDFNCPWSYLAFRRAALLVGDGTELDLRAVEHDPAGPGEPAKARSVRVAALAEEMETVVAELLPGEHLPYALAGFVPDTAVAVAAYAAAYDAGVAVRAAEVLFEAFWLHGCDLSDADVVHTLLVDAVRSDAARSEPMAAWEYGVGADHEARSEVARLVEGWSGEWKGFGEGTVPVAAVDGDRPLHGLDAVRLLGAEVERRQLV